MQDAKLPENYSAEQIVDYQKELKFLLERVGKALNHYEMLGVDYLASHGEIRLAYMKCTAMLNPALYNLNLPQPEGLLPEIDEAFEKISTAYSVLVNFTRREVYDDLLFEREEIASDLTPAPSPIVVHLNEVDETEANPVLEYVERRRYQRFELKLPVRVIGHHPANGRWQELTRSSDVSISGALVTLSMPVRIGMILHLSMPMPMTLRCHGFFEDPYEVYAIVRRIVRYQNDFDQIGLEFIGEEPPVAYKEKPWGIFQTEADSYEDRRRSTRNQIAKHFQIEYFDNNMNLLAKEDAITEDVSRSGMRVCVKAAPTDLFMVKVESTNGNFEGYADVVNRYQGEDNLERLCLIFLAQNF